MFSSRSHPKIILICSFTECILPNTLGPLCCAQKAIVPCIEGCLLSEAGYLFIHISCISMLRHILQSKIETLCIIRKYIYISGEICLKVPPQLKQCIGKSSHLLVGRNRKEIYPPPRFLQATHTQHFQSLKSMKTCIPCIPPSKQLVCPHPLCVCM